MAIIDWHALQVYNKHKLTATHKRAQIFELAQSSVKNARARGAGGQLVFAATMQQILFVVAVIIQLVGLISLPYFIL